MTKSDIEMLINENKMLKLELQKLRSKSEFETEFSGVDNSVTEKSELNHNSEKDTPMNKRFKKMSIDLDSAKSYNIINS